MICVFIIIGELFINSKSEFEKEMENNKYMLMRYNISADDVRKEMNTRNILSRVHEEILEQAKKSFPFKELKEISVSQFMNVAVQSDSNDANVENKKLDTARIGMLASSVDNVLQRKIKESFKSTPNSLMEDIVASIASRKHPESANNNDAVLEKSETSGKLCVSHESPSEMIKDKHFFQSLHRLLAGSIANLRHIKQQVDEPVIADDSEAVGAEGNFKQKKTDFDLRENGFTEKINEENWFSIPESNRHSEVIQSLENIENIFDSDDSNQDLDVLFETSSNCSNNSVHTSDLSSYDDEISISSEDEDIFGRKHISVKEATEICYGSPIASGDKNVEYSSHSVKRTKNTESTENISSNVESPKKELPQRKRKQNPKYSSDDILAYSPISSNFPKKLN